MSTKGLWPQCVPLVSSGSNQGGCLVTLTCTPLSLSASKAMGLSQFQALGLRPAQVSQQQLVQVELQTLGALLKTGQPAALGVKAQLRQARRHGLAEVAHRHQSSWLVHLTDLSSTESR